MTPTLVFDIETIPDTAGLRALLDAPDVDLSGASDEDIANIAFHQRRQKNGTDFPPLHQHKICAISCALREGNNFKASVASIKWNVIEVKVTSFLDFTVFHRGYKKWWIL